jgi:hypothetical protein
VEAAWHWIWRNRLKDPIKVCEGENNEKIKSSDDHSGNTGAVPQRMFACHGIEPATPAGSKHTSSRTQSDIGTAAAQTVEAQNRQHFVAQTMEAQATLTPTATATLFSLPTVTPFVVTTPTVRSSGGGGAPPKAEYSCDIIHQRPYDNQEFLHGQEFDIKWTILNTGTKTWPAV